MSEEKVIVTQLLVKASGMKAIHCVSERVNILGERELKVRYTRTLYAVDKAAREEASYFMTKSVRMGKIFLKNLFIDCPSIK